jgi:hypothetical protein
LDRSDFKKPQPNLHVQWGRNTQIKFASEEKITNPQHR